MTDPMPPKGGSGASDHSEEVIVNEISRTYHWLQGNLPTLRLFTNVVSVRVSASGTHYLRLGNGGLQIIKPTWDWIDIVPETPEKGWTF